MATISRGVETPRPYFWFSGSLPAADQPAPRRATESEKATGTANQEFISSLVVAFGDEGIHKPNNANNDATVQTQNVVS